MSDIKLYNTKTKEIEIFRPINEKNVTLYHCGPTVYNFPHIGNMRAYVFADTLRRMLEWNKYNVTQVVNITDVGHLVSDADDGEDKIELGAKREGLGVEDIIYTYSKAFYDDLHALNIKPANHFPRASKHIEEQIELIKKLEDLKYTYITSDGVYFDTSHFEKYADFARLDIEGLSGGERIDLGEKKNKTDFALWKFNADGKERLQEWDSPWGKGFPGWHIECSAMSMKYLGETIDIHTGGVDHINIHHTNEIAQSEAATGKTFANYWMHVAFMNVDNQKMSKSLGNTYRISELPKFDISPLAYRYWLLTSHYSTQVNFTFEAVVGSEKAYNRLRKEIHGLGKEMSIPDAPTLEKATEFINSDLNTARVIALIHEIMSTDMENSVLLSTISKIDEILGLSLLDYREEVVAIPPNIEQLLNARQKAREMKDWSLSDVIRGEILSFGYIVKDTANGQEINRAE